MVIVLIEVAVLFAIGVPAPVIGLAIVFVQINGLFQHANINIKLGWLNLIFSGPELHRWHHSKVVSESDNNFGNNVIIWDLLFGSYFLPKHRQVGVLGLLNPDYPKRFWAQAKAPFGVKKDKPADYATRPEHYLQQVEQQNVLELQRLQNPQRSTDEFPEHPLASAPKH